MNKQPDRRALATTFLTHYFGRGLVDENRCYAVERFRSLSNGDIRRWPLDAPTCKKVRGRPKPEGAFFEAVRDLRSAYNEINRSLSHGARLGQIFVSPTSNEAVSSCYAVRSLLSRHASARSLFPSLCPLRFCLPPA